MRRLGALLVALMLVLTGAGCAEEPTVKIGVIEPLSGVYAAAGQTEYQGILEAIKERPMLGDRRVELVTADNLSTPEGAKAAAEQLVQADVELVIGSWGSSLAAAAVEVLDKAGIPAVATTAVIYDNDSYFGLGLAESWQGAALAALAAEQSWERVAVIYDARSDYDIAIRNAFIEAAGRERICAEALVDGNLADCVAAMEQAQADALLVPSLADEVQVSCAVMGGDVCEGAAVYRAVYGKVSDVGYDAYQVAMAMLEGKTVCDGRTGRLEWQAGFGRTAYLLHTPDGVKRVELS